MGRKDPLANAQRRPERPRGGQHQAGERRKRRQGGEELPPAPPRQQRHARQQQNRGRHKRVIGGDETGAGFTAQLGHIHGQSHPTAQADPSSQRPPRQRRFSHTSRTVPAQETCQPADGQKPAQPNAQPRRFLAGKLGPLQVDAGKLLHQPPAARAPEPLLRFFIPGLREGHDRRSGVRNQKLQAVAKEAVKGMLDLHVLVIARIAGPISRVPKVLPGKRHKRGQHANPRDGRHGQQFAL